MAYFRNHFTACVLLFFGLMWGLILPSLATAQDAAQSAPEASPKPAAAPKDAILILDASGSMWGQIGGVNKIVIAKDVVEELVRGLSAGQRLGLVAYGHRREGDCADIQTLADVGASRADVISAIRSLSPKGKTPLTKSVEHAANALNYTKNAASVILVSDGLETCNADPCALAKTLEENGLDFTVHVIGFDVTVEERAGLKCIADETGGEFLAADNADELTDALSQVTAAQAPPVEEAASAPVPSSLAMKATILQNGPQIMSKLSWKVTPAAGGAPIFTAENTGAAETEIVPGDYVAEAVWTGWKSGEAKKGRMTFAVKAQQPKVITVPIDLELPVTLEAPDTTPEGVAFPVRWSGPDALNTTININRLDDDPLKKLYFFPAARARANDKTAADTDGDGDVDNDDMASAELGAPTIAGNYEIRYVLNDPVVILARRSIVVTDSQYTLSAPASAPVSTEIEIVWDGPLTKGDIITLVPKGDKRAFDNGNYRPLKKGAPVTLTTPPMPGDYELRYVMAGGYTTYAGMAQSVQTSIPIKVTDVSASVQGPATAIGGSTIDVVWTGPAADWEDDFVSVVTPGAEKFNRDSWAKLVNRAGEKLSPAPLRIPAIEGTYELVYGLSPGGRILARTPITIERAKASVDAPASVKMGEAFTITYSGDRFKGDRVVIVPTDTPDFKMWSVGANYGFFVSPDGTTGNVRPTAAKKPGAYEARYVTGLQHQVLARDSFIVTE